MRLPCFGVALSAMMLFRTGIGAIPFLLPMMLQVGFGDSAVQSGLITFASSAGALVMKPATQRALRLFGFRDTLVWNGVISRGDDRRSAPRSARPGRRRRSMRVLLIGGFFRSLQFTAYNTLAYGDVPRSRMSSATSLYITVPAACRHDRHLGRRGVAGDLDAHVGHTRRRSRSISAHAFLVVALFTLVAAPIALLMPRNAGDELTGRRAVGDSPGLTRPAGRVAGRSLGARDHAGVALSAGRGRSTLTL